LGAAVATERVRALAATGAALLIESTSIAFIETVESAATGDGRCATDIEPAATPASGRLALFLLVAILAESGAAFRRSAGPIAAGSAAGFASADAAAVRSPLTAPPNVAAGWAMFA